MSTTLMNNKPMIADKDPAAAAFGLNTMFSVPIDQSCFKNKGRDMTIVEYEGECLLNSIPFP
jgi:hypothetical protein